MKIKVIIIWILLILLPCEAAFPDILKTHTFTPVEIALSNVDKDTLVVLDVDEVLITSVDQYFKRPRGPVNDKLYSEFKKDLSPERYDYLDSILYLESKFKVTNQKLIQLIKKLQENHIPVLALTAVSPGKLGKIQSRADWRIQHLKGFGISFAEYWNKIKSKYFTEFKVNDSRKQPLFKSGILFSSNTPKGEVLKAFLAYINLKPKKIIFLDDMRKNLESVEYFCNQQGIEFLGFEYLASYTQVKPINEELVRFQLNTLKSKEYWLNDEEAEKQLLSLQAQ